MHFGGQTRLDRVHQYEIFNVYSFNVLFCLITFMRICVAEALGASSAARYAGNHRCTRLHPDSRTCRTSPALTKDAHNAQVSELVKMRDKMMLYIINAEIDSYVHIPNVQF